MSAVRITLLCLRVAAAQPATWVLWTVLLLSWPLWVMTAPIGINSRSSTDSGIFYHLAIMSFAVGAVRGIGPVARLSRSLVEASSAPRLPTHMLAVGSVALLHVLITAIPAIVMGAFHAEPDGLALAVRLSLVFLTILSCSSLLLRFEVEAASAPWVLGVAILLSPMLLPDLVPTRSLLLLSGALLSASWLLDHQPGRTT